MINLTWINFIWSTWNYKLDIINLINPHPPIQIMLTMQACSYPTDWLRLAQFSLSMFFASLSRRFAVYSFFILHLPDRITRNNGIYFCFPSLLVGIKKLAYSQCWWKIIANFNKNNKVPIWIWEFWKFCFTKIQIPLECHPK